MPSASSLFDARALLLILVGLTGGLTMPNASAAENVTRRTLTVGARKGDLATIQKAVDAAKPGDTVLVRGGHYRESVTFPNSGAPGLPITVRGMPGQVVLVTPSTPLTGTPGAVEGHPNVFRWDGFEHAAFAPEPEVEKKRKGRRRLSPKIGFWEAPSHLRLKRVYSLAECERRLGSWFYDTRTRALHIRSSGAAPAKDMVYVIEDAARPVFDIRQSHITLQGLCMAFGAHGVLIIGRKAHHVTVRNCRAFCNRAAGIHLSGSHHVLEDNELFRNNHYGIQLRYGVQYSRIARNVAYYNGPNNGEATATSLPTDIGTYSKGGYNVFENNVIDGLHQYAFRNKYGANNTVVFRNNVVRGFFYCQSPCIRNNTVIVDSAGVRFGQYINRVDKSVKSDIAHVDPDGVQRRTSIIYPAVDTKAPGFVDPAWRDFRLQADSPYRGKGAFPGETPVMFVDPEKGSDENDGRSIRRAFKSLARAMKTVHPGDTVTLMPGTYTEPLEISVGGLSAREPLRFRAYGKSPSVILKGGIDFKARVSWSLKGVSMAHISLEGLTVADSGIKANGVSDVRLSYCVLNGSKTALALSKCAGVRVDHVTFRKAATGIQLTDCSDVSITNSLFIDTETGIACGASTLPELYADHNTYTALRNRLSRRAVTDLAAWRKAVQAAASSRIAPATLDKAHALPMGSPLAFAASDFTFAGARPAPAAKRLGIHDLQVAGLGPTTASLLWETPRGMTESRVEVRQAGQKTARVVEPITTFQIMGEYFDMTFRLSGFYTAARNAPLNRLKPNTSYEARVTAMNVERTASHTETIRFKTPARAGVAATYYVATTGDDGADGLSAKTAWRSFARATGCAAPGDRVVVLPGVYSETLRPRTCGTKARPIVYESAEPRGAVIDVMRSLSAGIEVANVDYVHVKGFALKGGAFTKGDNFVIGNARGIRISGCQVHFPAGSSFAKMRLGHGGLIATNAPDLLVDNNVFTCGFVGVGLGSCPGAKVLNNTILGEGNYGVTLVPSSVKEHYVVRNNLFYRPVMGYKTGAAFSMYNMRPSIDADYNLYYIPAKYKGTIGMMDDRVRHKTLAEWQKASGYDAHSVAVEPLFVDPEKGDFRLKPGSPGMKCADDGGIIGARTPAD